MHQFLIHKLLPFLPLSNECNLKSMKGFFVPARTNASSKIVSFAEIILQICFKYTAVFVLLALSAAIIVAFGLYLSILFWFYQLFTVEITVLSVTVRSYCSKCDGSTALLSKSLFWRDAFCNIIQFTAPFLRINRTLK